ncbi:hypothetical protein [Candidatus Pelagibacter communis]|uniref:hypothetical protein n=1 Tax=Pelagibacter ubique TaxID=198252 RepID=UPI00065B4004|nr:hypothetical protein [Candidatus Pelagibacter ubique]
MNKVIELLKFKKKYKQKYSDNWIAKIDCDLISKYIHKKHNYQISRKASVAIAKAEIAIVYRDLVLKEENENIKDETMEGEWKS